MTIAWHSFIQIVPDIAAREAVNAGVIVIEADTGAVHIKVDGSCARAERAFARNGLNVDELRRSIYMAKTHILAERNRMRSVNDLRAHANAMGGLVRITEPRWIDISNSKEWIEDTYQRLVLPHHNKREKIPEYERGLRRVFSDLEAQKRVVFGERIHVPHRSFSVQSSMYYENGRRNIALIRSFNARDENKSMAEVGTIAVRAKLFSDAGVVDGKRYAVTLIPRYESVSVERQFGRFLRNVIENNGGEVQEDIDAYHRHVANEADVLSA